MARRYRLATCPTSTTRTVRTAEMVMSVQNFLGDGQVNLGDLQGCRGNGGRMRRILGAKQTCSAAWSFEGVKPPIRRLLGCR